jgi:hypothetical protein
MNKLNCLSNFLLREGLKTESLKILNLLKIARTDEDLNARSDHRSLPAAERKRILSNMSIYKTLTPEKRSELAHSILDAIGMVPGVGDVADLTNAIWYAGEGNYSMAALSCVFLTPGLGTPAAALAKSTKVLPAKVIYEYADVFEDLITRLAPEIPNGPLVKQAVDQIIEGARKGYDLSLETGKSIMKETSQQVGEAAAKVMDPANAWYLNPKWQEWFLKLLQPALTRVLNSVTERSFKTRLIKMLNEGVFARSEQLKALKFVTNPEMAALTRMQIIEGNTQLSKDISAAIVRLIDDVKNNVKIKMITSKADIPEGFTSARGMIDLETYEIKIFLPNYTQFLSSPSSIVEFIQSTISHEVWHLIDRRMQSAVFNKDIAGRMWSELYSTSEYISSIKKVFNFEGWSKEAIEDFSDHSEIYVRIKSLKAITYKLWKKNLDYDTLEILTRNLKNPEFATIYSKIPSDAMQLLKLLRSASPEQLRSVVSFMNKVP